MAYRYLECANNHIYRALRTGEKDKTACPYCGSEWSFETSKEAWIKFRVAFWNQHRKYHREE